MSELRVSIVIPTRNHLQLLKRLLNSLESQTLAPSFYEVIVVDDGSTDGTVEFLRQAKFPFRFRYIEGQRQGPPRARNAGITLAEAPIVGCMDNDVRLRADCLTKALPYFHDEHVGIVETTLYIEGEDRPLQIHPAAQGFVTAAIFFRKEAAAKVQGFDPEFFDTDTGLFFRDDADIGFRILEAGYTALQPEDVVAWHPAQFPSVKSSFAHVKRYMFDPLLYRKHPRLFRKYIERKRMWLFTFGRPMHYGCLFFLLSIVGAIASASFVFVTASWFFAASAFIAHIAVRFKFEGSDAVKVYRVKETAVYVVLPFWYFLWLSRGIRKFGGWKVIL